MHREATDLAGVRHIVYETLGSTNAEALSRARAGEHGPLWITAAAQSAGRGRRGSQWISPPGNLYATLLLTEPSSPQDAPQLSFVAALALHDAVLACAPELGDEVRLKWPNDVLLNGSKVAGLLIEGESAPVFAAAIGIGVNCNNHPLETSYPATDLAAAEAPVAPSTLIEALSAAMIARLDQWDAGTNFAMIRAAWLERAAGLGGDIRVRLPERELTGKFRGLDDAGRLLLQQAGQPVETITAGSVFMLGAGSP